jgi:hypothetical protein
VVRSIFSWVRLTSLMCSCEIEAQGLTSKQVIMVGSIPRATLAHWSFFFMRSACALGASVYVHMLRTCLD